MRILIALFLILSVSGCSSVAIIDAGSESIPDNGYGFVAFKIDSSNSGTLTDNLTLLSGRLKKAGEVYGADIEPRVRPDTRVLILPAGSYTFGDFRWGGERWLNIGREEKEFKVVENQVTWLGQYTFVFYFKNGLFGAQLAGFEHHHSNNLKEMDPIIRRIVNNSYPNRFENIAISYQSPLL